MCIANLSIYCLFSSLQFEVLEGAAEDGEQEDDAYELGDCTDILAATTFESSSNKDRDSESESDNHQDCSNDEDVISDSEEENVFSMLICESSSDEDDSGSDSGDETGDSSAETRAVMTGAR